MRGLKLGFGIARGCGNSGPPVPAVITIVSVSTQESDGDVPVSYTIDKNDATVECVVFPAASPNPTAAQFNGGGAPTYVDQGTVSLTTSGGPINLTITGTFAGSVKLALLPTGGGDGDVVVSSAFTLDTTAPTVSLSPADGATGVVTTSNIVMTFSEAMKTQGTVDLRVVGGALIESFDLATEGTWSSGDTVWTGNPASDFTAGASLCVRWSGLEDTKGNALADNTGDTLWNFGVANSYPSVAATSAGYTGFATSLNITAPATSATDTILLVVSRVSALTSETVPSNFTSVGALASAGIGWLSVYKWDGTGTRPNNNTQTITVAGGSGAIQATMFAISGASSVGAGQVLAPGGRTSHQSPSFSATAGSLIFHIWSLRQDTGYTTTFTGSTPDETTISPPDSEGTYMAGTTSQTAYHRCWIIQQPSGGTINRMTLATTFNTVGGVFFEVLL
jgi:hypothetical protein